MNLTENICIPVVRGKTRNRYKKRRTLKRPGEK